MGESAVSELILIAVEIMVAALVISIITGYWSSANNAVTKMNNESDNFAIIENNLEFQKYNGTKVTGSDVLLAYQKYRGVIVGGEPFSLRGVNDIVRKGDDGLFRFTNTSKLLSTYKATILTTDTGVVNGIIFIEE